MDFFDAVKARRSIRKFTEKSIPNEVVERALEAALVAPNSSNTQTWDFYRVQSEGKKTELIRACMNQAAARSARELLVAVADPKRWKRSVPRILETLDRTNAPKSARLYYTKLIPFVYNWGPLNSLGVVKSLIASVTGVFRPIPRGPNTKRDNQEVAIKSCALACENFVLAMAAQGYATCMMEGFDEVRVKRLLRLSPSARVVMVIAMGEEAPGGRWGEQIRVLKEEVVHLV